MINYYNSLKYLKQLGLKTFSPFIDESYDTIKNGKERATAIYNEIKRLFFLFLPFSLGTL